VSFRIRRLERSDIDLVLELAQKSSEAPRWTRRNYEQVLLDTGAPFLARHGLVAVCEGKLVGFAVASWLPQEPAAELEGLFVEQTLRRRGIGASLLRGCMSWAASAGASAIRLEVRASNGGALAVYRGNGFSTTGVRPGYYSAPEEDALLLEAAL
jgi:[ribosomal protein S18]-alanine N-acetyltransferase